MSDAGSPWLLVLEHRVQNREELSHASGEGNLLRCPSGEQVRVEASQYLVVPDADQRAHVQDGADLGPPSPDGAVSTQRSTVAIQRRDTDERNDLLAVQLAELGQFREKGCRDYAAYAGYAAQQVVFLAPDRAFANRCGQVIVDLLEPLPKPLHVLADTTAEIRRRRALPVLLRDEHLDELPPPRDESGESLSLLVGSIRGSGCTASAKCASTAASSASVLASLPVALAKSRTCLGLTTATGTCASASAAVTAISSPPVASTTTNLTRCSARRSSKSAMPASV